jgi:hypothetical protein
MNRTIVLLLSFCAISLPAVRPASAVSIDLTSDTSGSLVSGQSFNETRGVDVTVLSPMDLIVTSMRLDGLIIGSPALVGARIYDSTTRLLIAAGNTTVIAGGPVSIPITATLISGDQFRLAFNVATVTPGTGSGTFFDPAPPGTGGFPYTESLGLLQINSAHSISTDSFPSNDNFFVPQITVEATIVPEPDSITLLGLAAVSLVVWGWRKKRGAR